LKKEQGEGIEGRKEIGLGLGVARRRRKRRKGRSERGGGGGSLAHRTHGGEGGLSIITGKEGLKRPRKGKENAPGPEGLRNKKEWSTGAARENGGGRFCEKETRERGGKSVVLTITEKGRKREGHYKERRALGLGGN